MMQAKRRSSSDAGGDVPWKVTAHSPDDLPAAVQDQLREGDLEGMQFPVDVVHRPAEANESWHTYGNFDWTDAGSHQKRPELSYRGDEYPAHIPRWYGDKSEMSDDSLIGARDDIVRASKAKLTPAQMTDIVDTLPGIDPVEGAALRRDFYGTSGTQPIDYYAPDVKNARVTTTFDEGANITYIESKVAPQPEFGGPKHPGGRQQRLLLDFDPSQSVIEARPLGASISSDESGRTTYDYPDNGSVPNASAPNPTVAAAPGTDAAAPAAEPSPPPETSGPSETYVRETDAPQEDSGPRVH